MSVNTKILSVLFLSAALVLSVTSLTLAQGKVRAKIGIQVKSGDDLTRPAKAKDRLKAGDELRIYVIPEADAYVYIVHREPKVVTLLNKDQQKVKNGARLVLPADRFYRVDGTSNVEFITVICSPTELTEVAALLSAKRAPPSKWASLERALSEKSKIDLSDKSEKPFAITGNVRDLESDRFLHQLQIFSGNSLLVKRYEFDVKK